MHHGYSGSRILKEVDWEDWCPALVMLAKDQIMYVQALVENAVAKGDTAQENMMAAMRVNACVATESNRVAVRLKSVEQEVVDIKSEAAAYKARADAAERERDVAVAAIADFKVQSCFSFSFTIMPLCRALLRAVSSH